MIQKKKVTNKGKFFAYWGWNWASYSDADIHFKGDNYDFTLSDVKAQDRQTKFSFNKYFNPGNVTIPQTNYRIGYFFKENYTVSIGVDHMKYVMIDDQNVKINGNINDGNAKYDGTYNNETVNLAEDFLRFEHTDGLNYVNVELKRFDDVSHWFGLNLENLQINLTEGFGMGILYPKTNSKLLGKDRNDSFHLSGYGASLVAGVNISFLKHFYVQADLKGGHIYMPDVKTTSNSSDSASQNFFFLQKTILIGGKFRL
ncbi:hypothetical protein J2Q17_10340 [Tenacibaculum piscium]|nr:hypothetical protein [Tenacibaculum piscium]MBE7671420.1 hypothetical protein [Tenacibaculum piscium]MBE7686086.1 hypothetical protein [Tenacibaculum piscium]MBE7690977.1 hypothetical protein [Tenacibaculum piscium]MCG8184345.1 hypothetical protein [Tenacibaculum piscium]